MPDDHDEERLLQHEAILRSLTAMLVEQHDFNRQQVAINADVKTAIERIDRTLAHVEITQARVETLLARLIRHEENGRDA